MSLNTSRVGDVRLIRLFRTIKFALAAHPVVHPNKVNEWDVLDFPPSPV